MRERDRKQYLHELDVICRVDFTRAQDDVLRRCAPAVAGPGEMLNAGRVTALLASIFSTPGLPS